MKTNQLTCKRINILFCSTALLFFPLIGSAQLKVVSGGNVGIGTATPNTYTGYTTLGINNATNGGILDFLNNGTLVGQISNNSTTFNLYASSSIPMLFYAGGSERMRITSGGNVGIGTTTPGSTLQLLNTTHTSPNTTYSALYGGTMTMLFRANGPDGYLFANSYYNSSNAHIYASNGGAACVLFNSTGAGYIDFSTAPSGTLGGAVTYTKRMTIAEAGNVGIGTTSPSQKLEVNGSVAINGNCTRTGADNFTSDQQFKTDIDSIHNALAIIKQLKPKTYYFDTTNVYGLNFPSKKNYGFVAQDLEQILPELVSTNNKNADVDTSGNIIHPAVTYKGVYYIELIAFLTKGIQEQQQKIDNLTTKTTNQDSINTAVITKASNQDSIIASLQNQLVTNNTLFQNQLNQLMATINNCCTINEGRSANTQSESSIKQTDVKLTDAQTIVLEQNVPNPFAEQTTINYSLPDNTVKAQMLFYNAQGKLIQSTELTQKGKGTLNVFASDLSSGIYTYTLVVDGKIIETRKMVKQ
ncbi:MAG: tail fiber domain-containing protein [Bacteroidetes bacterium]|nr:tail fiber domain-containing protein [Bacteroidota bacterium]